MDPTSITLTQLLNLKAYAKHLKVDKKRASVTQMQSGRHSTQYRGRGVDFSEVRIYCPGDDIRTLDWRVTARTGQTHTKIFRQEQERPVLILVDLGPSMRFASQGVFKSVLAAQIAALIAWSTLEKGDRIGGLVCNAKSHQEIKPKRSKNTLLHLLRSLERLGNETQLSKGPTLGYLSSTINKLYNLVRPGSDVYLISDFLNMREDSWHNLGLIRRHSNISAIKVQDPLEVSPPKAGVYKVFDGKQSQLISTKNKLCAQNLQKQMLMRLKNLENQFNQKKIPLMQFYTNQDCYQQLLKHFSLYSVR